MSDTPRNPEHGEAPAEVIARISEIFQSVDIVAHIPEVFETRAHLYFVPEQPVQETIKNEEEPKVVPFPSRTPEPKEQRISAAENDLDRGAIDAKLDEIYGQQEAA